MFEWLSRVKPKKIDIRVFVGAQGSGKGFKCKKLVEEQGYIQLDFADALRDMVWKILDWEPLTDKEYENFKKGTQYVPNFGKVDGRYFLQQVGTLMRGHNQNYWVDRFCFSLEKLIAMGYDKFCVSDARFINELKAILSYKNKANIKIEFCNYKSERYNDVDTHESERLAQKFLKLGFKDGQEISESDLKSIDSFTRI